MEMPWRPGLKTCSGTDSVGANRQSAGVGDASLIATAFPGEEEEQAGCEQPSQEDVKYDTEHLPQDKCGRQVFALGRQEQNISSPRDVRALLACLPPPSSSSLCGIGRPERPWLPPGQSAVPGVLQHLFNWIQVYPSLG